MPTRTQQLMSATAKAVFRLNGHLVALAEELAAPAGLTAAWWQVLGSVLGEPRSVADISREIGITRQSVQRVADVLVEKRLAYYEPNPAHRRAKLLATTSKGRQAIRRISPHHAAFADRLVAAVGEAQLATIASDLTELSRTLGTLLGRPVGSSDTQVPSDGDAADPDPVTPS